MMAYSSNFVASIIHNGKPLREYNSDGTRTCKVPYGSEYKIRLINRSNHRAMATVNIDGTEVISGGKKIILRPGESMDLERFVDDLDVGKRFKFVSAEEAISTGEIQDPYSKENGVVEVLFYPEKPAPFLRGFSITNGTGQQTNSRRKSKNTPLSTQDVYVTNSVQDSGISYSVGSDPTEHMSYVSMDCMELPIGGDMPKGVGVTVEGSHSNQGFVQGESFEIGAPVSIKIKLAAPAPMPTDNPEIKFGIFVGGKAKVFFTEKKDAIEYMAQNDFGSQSVSLKPM